MVSRATSGFLVGREMTATSRKREVFANPFFVVLMIASVIFVLTVLAYLIGPSVLEPDPAKPPPTASSRAMAEWVDRNAPWLLAVEIAIMVVTGVLAMLTDRWFSPRKKPQSPA
jgi:hypothetical protein